jgi:hypothetical protein
MGASPATPLRTRAPRALLLAVLLTALALFAVAARPAPSQARPLETGISGIGDFNPLSFQRTREAGANFVRFAVNWASVAPKTRPDSWQPTDPADPHYDWSYIDLGITEAVQAGLQPLVLIEGAPTWAQRCVSPPHTQLENLCDPDPAELANFATAAARRYSGSFANLPRVQYWQGLNEPNLTLFFFPQFNTEGKGLSADFYRPLINSFYTAIKSVNPANLVVAAGLGPTELKGYNIGPLRWTRELLCMKGSAKKPKPKPGNCNGGVYFDIYDIHPYSTGGPTHEGRPNDVQMGDLGKLQALLKAADKAGRIHGQFKRTPLWITEFSWDSNPPDPGGLPEKILTQWVAEAMHEAWANGVQKFFWYGLRDELSPPGVPQSQTSQAGLYLRGPSLQQDQPKEVLSTFRFPFVAFAGKKKQKRLDFWGRTPNSGGGRVVIQLLRGGKWKKAKVLSADGQGIFKGTLKTAYGANRRGSVRATFGERISVPFPMKRVGDFHHPPFG